MKINLTPEEFTCIAIGLGFYESNFPNDPRLPALQEKFKLEVYTCPVCAELFTQPATGRRAEYCSTRCKQKAYRQRENEQKRESLMNARHRR